MLILMLNSLSLFDPYLFCFSEVVLELFLVNYGLGILLLYMVFVGNMKGESFP